MGRGRRAGPGGLAGVRNRTVHRPGPTSPQEAPTSPPPGAPTPPLRISSASKIPDPGPPHALFIILEAPPERSATKFCSFWRAEHLLTTLVSLNGPNYLVFFPSRVFSPSLVFVPSLISFTSLVLFPLLYYLTLLYSYPLLYSLPLLYYFPLLYSFPLWSRVLL